MLSNANEIEQISSDSDISAVAFTSPLLDSFLRRACQRLKPYIFTDPNQKTEQSLCEKQLGESWEREQIQK